MTDPAAFLLARLAEEEADALAATGGHVPTWHADAGVVYAGDLTRPDRCDDEGHQAGVPNPCDDMIVADVDGDFTPLAAADHIARHDPARVLRQVAVMRRVVEGHGRAKGMRLAPKGSRDLYEKTLLMECASCGWPGEYGEAGCREDYPCPTTRALAAIWADHPDYREEWAL